MIKETLNLLLSHGSVAELRIIGAYNDRGFPVNYYGYFDNVEKMAEAAAKYGKNAPAVYFTLQELKPDLIARSANRMKQAKPKENNSAKDGEVKRYRWFPIDLDPTRPQGISSSDDEKAAAKSRAEGIKGFLFDYGFNDPIFADSGNGYHLLYRVDLENNQENQELLKNCLVALHDMFSDDAVKVDRCNFNPSRIWKLYGTMARKGDDMPGRPHRKAAIITIPAAAIVTPVSVLKSLAELAIKEEKKKPVHTPTVHAHGEIDVTDFCSKHGLSVAQDSTWKDGIKYRLEPCPFNSDHSEAIVIKHPSGAVSFKCLHNGCFGKTWQDLREVYEPKATRQTQASVVVPKRADASKERLARLDSNDIDEMFSELQTQESGETVTIPLPWTRLSSGCDGLRPGTLTVIAGPLKTGKSFFVMNIIKSVQDMGLSWSYLPLEDDRKSWLWRMLAILDGNYAMTKFDQEGAGNRAATLLKYQPEIARYMANVTQNPRVGVRNSFGETVIPPVTGDNVLSWVGRAAKKSRVIVVDPLSQIEFPGNKPYEQEAAFIRKALGIIQDTNSSMILVAHTIKRSGANAAIDLSAEDVQGSAMMTRLAHTTLLIDRCELQTRPIARIGGTVTDEEINRVVTIAASRNGGCSGSKLGFLQGLERPSFTELGFLAPNKKKGGR